MLQDFVVTIEVPLLMNVKTIELKVSSNGSVEFVVPDLYSLSVCLFFFLCSILFKPNFFSKKANSSFSLGVRKKFWKFLSN